MARMKCVNGEHIPMTAEEEAERDAEELKWEQDKPLRDKQAVQIQLANSDAGLVRVVEDIYKVLTPEQKAGIPAQSVQKINDRLALRGKL